MDWLYENKLLPSVQTVDGWLIFYLYMLADWLSVIRLKIALMTAIFHGLSSCYVSNTTVCTLFEALPNNNPLLQLAVGAFCINDGIEHLGTESLASIDSLSKEYLTRMMRKFHQLSPLPKKERKPHREHYSMTACLPGLIGGGEA